VFDQEKEKGKDSYHHSIHPILQSEQLQYFVGLSEQLADQRPIWGKITISAIGVPTYHNPNGRSISKLVEIREKHVDSQCTLHGTDTCS
jgi:hypothetical protein